MAIHKSKRERRGVITNKEEKEREREAIDKGRRKGRRKVWNKYGYESLGLLKRVPLAMAQSFLYLSDLILITLLLCILVVNTHTQPLLLHTLFLLCPSALLFLIPPPLPHNQPTNTTNATTPTTTKSSITAALERPFSISNTHPCLLHSRPHLFFTCIPLARHPILIHPLPTIIKKSGGINQRKTRNYTLSWKNNSGRENPNCTARFS